MTKSSNLFAEALVLMPHEPINVYSWWAYHYDVIREALTISAELQAQKDKENDQ